MWPKGNSLAGLENLRGQGAWMEAALHSSTHFEANGKNALLSDETFLILRNG